ncbi:TPA: EexN family lipoprotein [Escherichia coli]|nr:EexN family lipoprotein [Azovibrio sp.]HAY4757173.1 EexN family lipoprotein [Escherichia coli]HAY5066488.1 EexN family lipoprotein [Escherichia coli]
MKKLSLVLVVAAVLVGCNKTPEPVQSVDWYKEHKAEREAMLAKCKANPGELALTPNCVNAQAAKEAIAFGTQSGIKTTAPTFKKKGE